MKNPRSVVAVALLIVVAWLGIGGVGGQLIGKLSQVQKNDNSEFLPTDAESVRVANELAALRDGDSALPLIVVAERPEGVTPQDLAAIGTFAKDLPATAVEEEGASLGTVADFLVTPQVPVIPSEDGKAAMVVLSLNQAKINETLDSGERPLGGVVQTVRDQAQESLAADGLKTYVTGPGGYIADIVKAFAGIDGLLLAVTLSVVLLILLIVYRSPVLPFTVLLSAVFGLSLAGLIVFPLAEAGHIDLSGQSQGIMFILTVGAATDYALLLVARYKEELHEFESPWEAMKVAWRASVEPILASGTTVILGLLCLLLADLGSTRGLGPVGALGILGAMAASLTLLPALLVLGRRWIFWPTIPRYDATSPSETVTAALAADGHPKGWAKVARAVGRHPRRTWAITALALVAAAAFAPTFKADGITQSEVFMTKVESVDGQEVLARHFAAGAGSPVQILLPADKAEAALDVVQRHTDLQDGFIGTQPGRPSEPVDGKQIVQATLVADAESPEAGKVIEQLRTDLDAVSTDALVGGRAAEATDVRAASDRDFRVLVPTITLVVLLVLMVLLRAIVGPLVLMAANLLSFAATIGISALAFNHVFTFANADPSTMTIGFVFLIALGVDYSIFLMTRAREEVPKRGTRKGVLAALAVTGGVITSAGIVLAATFGALWVIPLLFLAQTAFIVSFGVLLDTFVVRSLLVPAIVHEIGDRTWWPSKWGARQRESVASTD